VAEAMYQYGDLALRGRNYEINCLEGLDWINKAVRKNYRPAKKTLGFLYLFAGNEPVLFSNDYIPCPFKEDRALGKKYLVEAVADGDTSAIRFLNLLDTTNQ